ncbi:FAD synthetase [Candidatus Magnetomorum sp. HK-1]|nr:FAD synthetase [Candidatus Magnetomorum sp. HK-1]
MMKNEIIKCKRCICSSSVPGVTVNNNGICSECEEDSQMGDANNLKKYISEMEERFDALRKKDIPYHALCMLSGGKDSTSILYLLKKKYGLRPLAFGVIHPFVNDLSIKNMKEAAKKLDVDLIQFHVEERIFKKFMRAGILEGHKHNLGEFFGCDICSRIYHRISVKMAIQMKIPYLLCGSDPIQTESPVLIDGEIFKKNRLSGRAYDNVDHFFDLFLEKDYKHSLYSPNFELYKKYDFPTKIYPFSFLNYDIQEIKRELADKNILSKQASDSNLTNCDVEHLFSYFSYKRYDCDPYVKIISRGIRRSMPTVLNQLSVNENVFYNREDHISFFDEYKKLLFYIAKNPDLKVNDFYKNTKDFSYLFDIIGKDNCFENINQIIRMHYYADFFDIDLEM